VSVTLGVEALAASNRLSGQRVGLVCNPASVDHQLRHSADVLTDAGATLAALFGPQHGFRSDRQDDMIETPHGRDATREVPVYSLYSETRIPTAEMLDGIDVMVVDLTDVGTRVYTYIYTMANCMRACKAHGVPVVVADRPNPVGGVDVEGPPLDPAWTSFVGQFPIPLRHGLTIGELAELFNVEFGLGADLDVVPMSGWHRTQYLDETDLPWVLPSPNLPTLDSLVVYPGMVLLEGTMLSEGRGTTRPFELFGAPWLDAEQLAVRLNGAELPGVQFRAAGFEPTFQKHAGEACGGCQIHVFDRQRYRPVRTALAIIDACRASDPARFGWKLPPYEYEHDRMPIDLLWGSDALRTHVDAGGTAVDLAVDSTAYLALREKYLRY
jgi:uncharacterized protein YbbC (DUF1343 family)